MIWLQFSARWSRISVTAVGLSVVLLFGVLDYVSGSEISVSIIYLIPIAAVAWLSGIAAGSVVSVMAAICYLTAILLEDHGYSHPSIPYWNALVRLGFFFVMAGSLSSLRWTRERREELRQFIIHDLRSPLANVMTGLSILRESYDDRLNEQQQGLVEMCLVSCTRMLTLINSLLDLGRLERGSMPIVREDVPAADLCNAALSQVRLWARQKEVEFEDFAPPDVVVRADVELTTRVIVNLLSNAVRYAPEGSVVNLRAAPHDASHVAFSVQDQGAGIPEEWAEKIFDAYTQVDDGRPVVGSGSGLGLTFARRAVQAQGGRIWMKSNPDDGTTVTFTIPIAKNAKRGSA